MANLKDIRRRLKSVNNTKKITYAMKLVSAAKLRKTQDAAKQAHEYAEALTSVLHSVVATLGQNDIAHPLMETRENPKRIALLVLGGARGLCGAYNTNINKAVERFYKQHAGKEVETFILGKKPAEYFRRVNRNYKEAIETLSEDPKNWPTGEVMSTLENAFMRGDFDEVYIAFTKFRSAISMSVTVEKLLPAGGNIAAADNSTGATGGVFLFEPGPKEVFDAIIPRIVRAKVREAAFSSKASEHASRMTAMDSATKNASELIHSLTLTRNRLRQSGITSQLLDIIGGAEALNN